MTHQLPKVIAIRFIHGMTVPDSCTSDKVKQVVSDLKGARDRMISHKAWSPDAIATARVPVWLATTFHESGFQAEYTDDSTGEPWTPE